MGLFGASWSWEEIQKKDAIMGELRKENNRVLDEQRKMLNKTEKKPLSQEEITYRGGIHQNERNLTISEIKANTVACKIISAIFVKGNDTISNLATLPLIFLGFILFITFFIGGEPFYVAITLVAIYYIGFRVLRVLYHLPSSIFNAIKIRKTSCYKNILNDIQQKNINDIQEIYVNKNQVLISRSCNL